MLLLGRLSGGIRSGSGDISSIHRYIHTAHGGKPYARHLTHKHLLKLQIHHLSCADGTHILIRQEHIRCLIFRVVRVICQLIPQGNRHIHLVRDEVPCLGGRTELQADLLLILVTNGGRIRCRKYTLPIEIIEIPKVDVVICNDNSGSHLLNNGVIQITHFYVSRVCLSLNGHLVQVDHALSLQTGHVEHIPARCSISRNRIFLHPAARIINGPVNMRIIQFNVQIIITEGLTLALLREDENIQLIPLGSRHSRDLGFLLPVFIITLDEIFREGNILCHRLSGRLRLHQMRGVSLFLLRADHR